MSSDSVPYISPFDRAAPSEAGWLRTAPFLVVAVALIGFHLNYPIYLALFERWGGPGLAPAFFASLPIALVGVLGWLPLVRSRVGRPCLLLYAGFVGWVLLAAAFAAPANTRDLVTPVSHVAILCGSAYLFARYWPAIRRYLAPLILVIAGTFCVWLVMLWRADMISPETSEPGILTFSRHGFSDLRSTEITMFLGPQLCYLLYLLRSRSGKRILVLGLVAANVFFTFFCGARAAIVAGALVLCLYALSGPFTRKLRMAALMALILLLAGGLVWPYVCAITEKSQSIIHLEEGSNVRLRLYPLLWAWAKDNPAFGVGHGRFIYLNYLLGVGLVPHNNVLGRACENGIPAGLLYLAFVVVALSALRPPRRRDGEPAAVADAKLFIHACLWVFIFQQFRGLFQDTWTLKEIPFVVGAGLGLKMWLKSNPAPTEAAQGQT